MNLLELYNTWIEPVTAVIGAFSVVAVATPTKKDDNIAGKLKGLINFIAFNWGGARVDKK